MKSQFGYEEPMVIIIDEIVFSQNQIFNKKWNSYVNFFLVLRFTPFVVDVSAITLLLSQIYVCANSYRLFNVPDRKWWHQQKGQHIFKMFVYNFYKNYVQSYFVPSLLQIEEMLNKLERVFQWLPTTQPTWPPKKPEACNFI